MSAAVVVKRGMRVVWKPEWMSKGEDKYTFIAVEDPHPITGTFGVSTIEHAGPAWLRGIQIGNRVDQVASAEPYLPVVTITFLGLDKKGARCQMRRMLGDHELSLTEETIPRATFYQVFRRYAKDCKPGVELRSGVEFPEEKTP